MSNRDEILERVRKTELLIKSVRDGDKVYCEVCGNELYFVEPGSGKVPGLYCGKGCTEIHVNMGPA